MRKTGGEEGEKLVKGGDTCSLPENTRSRKMNVEAQKPTTVKADKRG